MIVEYIRYFLNSEQIEGFLTAYTRAQTELKASQHCMGYELSQCLNTPERFILRIEWDSREGHLQGFRKSPEFQRFYTDIKPFIDQIEEMTHYTLTEIQSESRADNEHTVPLSMGGR